MTYSYKTKPFPHQDAWFRKTASKAAAGLFWEPGVAKTKPLIDTASYLYLDGKIDTLIVIAPNGVHRAWVVDEIPIHMPDEVQKQCRFLIWECNKQGTQKAKLLRKLLFEHKGLAVLVAGYEALRTKKFKAFCNSMLQKRRAMMVLDESHRIKGSKAKVTYSALAKARWACYRRIATGTPVEEPPDIYKQIEWLDEGFWERKGLRTPEEFRTRFCKFQTFNLKPETVRARTRPGIRPQTTFRQIVGYRDLETLKSWVSELCDRLTKEEAGLNLPPKLYSKRYFDLTPECRRVYDELDEEMKTILESGDKVEVMTPMVRMLRLQQIACGYVATARGEPEQLIEPNKPNARIEFLVNDVLPDISHQAIIWCAFKEDIRQIMARLGSSAVEYHGTRTADERELAKRQFLAGKAQWLVASKAMKEGHTLVNAKTAIYYSNSPVLIHRLQSEDRVHRPGQTVSVNIIDLIAHKTVDVKWVQALREKFDLASQLNGDNYRDWI